MEKTSVLLGGNGRSRKGDGYTQIPEQQQKICALCDATLASRSSPYFSSLVQQACEAEMSFQKDPSPSTAMAFAESYGHYPDLQAIDAFPLMFFVHPEQHTFMLYSDTVKDWFILIQDNEEKMRHQLDMLGSYANGGFQLVVDGTSYMFDATFREPLILDCIDNRTSDISAIGVEDAFCRSGAVVFH